MSQKLNGGGRERALQGQDLDFKIQNLWQKTSLFWSKTALEPAENGQRKEDGGYYKHR